MPRGARAARLEAELQGRGLGPAHLALLEEACRLVDLLDRLDSMIAGREQWVTTSQDGDRVVVVVDALLGERRQTATALRGLLAEVVKGLPKAAAPAGGKKGGALADLTAKIATRQQGAAG